MFAIRPENRLTFCQSDQACTHERQYRYSSGFDVCVRRKYQLEGSARVAPFIDEFDRRKHRHNPGWQLSWTMNFGAFDLGQEQSTDLRLAVFNAHSQVGEAVSFAVQKMYWGARRGAGHDMILSCDGRANACAALVCMCVKGSDPELEREAARESGAICRSGVDPRACGHAAKD